MNNAKQVTANKFPFRGGDHYSCALDEDGVQCWGGDWQQPVRRPLSHVNKMVVGLGGPCVLLSDDSVNCEATNFTSKVLSGLHGAVDIIAVDIYKTFTLNSQDTLVTVGCALDSRGVHCWEANIPPKGLFDKDKDGIPDDFEDINGNGVVDSGETDPLEPDSDGDGIADGVSPFYVINGDNCPLSANSDQVDSDGDGQGDLCDADADNDSVLDAYDALPLDATES
jgi:hypothetical protein